MKNLIDKAKSVGEDAAHKVTEVKDGVREAAANKIEELRDASVEKAREVALGFDATLPILKEAGYTVADVQLEIGIPPKLTAMFNVSEEVSADRIDALLLEHEDKKLVCTLVRALYAAHKVQTSIAIRGLKPRGIAVEIGLSPHIVVKFA